MIRALGLALTVSSAVAVAEPVDIDRNGDELRDLLVRPMEPDTDVFDTAVVISNPTPVRAAAVCVGFDHNGDVVGRVRVRVPAWGLRYFLTSDLGRQDFLGIVECRSANGGAVGSAYLLGNGQIDNLPVSQAQLRNKNVITVPVTLNH